LLCLATTARAQDLKDRFNIKLTLTGMYLTEQQAAAKPELNEASGGLSLGWVDLRTVMDARRLPGQFELHLDGRVRITPDEFSTDKATAGATQILSRGYFGGREYEVRQAYARRRGERVDFALGRMIVNEADALKIDGARLWVRFGKHWDVSAFGGSYPNPYSRSIFTDYNGFTFAGGADTSYTYDKIWGSVSAVGAYLGGLDDGGPFDPANPNGKPSAETPRVFFTWTDFVRLASWLDFFSGLVVDATGAAGAQLTRADLTATGRLGKHLTLRIGYDHLSSLAIEMYLISLISNNVLGSFALNRAQYVPTTMIENNLIISRTARDQGRLAADVTFGKLSIFAEGRIRHRSLANPGEDPQFNGAPTPTLALDGTIGLRDRGSLAGIRAGTWISYIADYRANSIIFDLDIGRSFWDEKLSIDAAFLYARTKDAGAGPPPGQPLCMTPTANPFSNAFYLGTCTGTRDGAEYELGFTVSGSPWKKWLGLLDYRLVVDETGGKPDILTHMLLMRIEARF